jgi:hypothetical protein
MTEDREQMTENRYQKMEKTLPRNDTETHG